MRQPSSFDWMEPERPRVDRAVLDFIKGHVFDPADFVISSNGVCRVIRKWRGWWWAEVSAQKIFNVDRLNWGPRLQGRLGKDHSLGESLAFGC